MSKGWTAVAGAAAIGLAFPCAQAEAGMTAPHPVASAPMLAPKPA
jgi:hypothetical protein